MNIDWFYAKRNKQRDQVLAQVEHLLEQKDYGMAIGVVDEAIKIDANYWKFHFYRGIVFTRLGNQTESIRSWKRAAQLAPLNLHVKWELGRALLHHGDAEAALPYLRSAVWRWPLRSGTYAHLGAAYLELGQFEKAEQTLNLGLSLNGANPHVRALMTRLYRETGRTTLITYFLRSYIKAAPEDAPPYYLMGEHCFFDLEQPDLAAEHFQRGLEQVGRSGASAAVREFEAANELPQTILETYSAALANSGRLEQAETVARHHVSRYPNRAKAIAGLGYVLGLQTAKAEEAIDCYERALKLEDNADWHTNAANVYLELERYDDAEREARLAADKAPSGFEHWFNLSIALSNLGRFDEALLAAERVQALVPDGVDGWQAVSEVHIKSKQWESARTALQRVVELDKSDLWAWENLARANEKLGRLDDAAQAYHELLARDPADAEAWLELGKVRQRQGQTAEAKSAVQRALEGRLTDDQRREAETLLANPGPGHR